MTLHSAFLLVFLSATLASCHLLTAQRAVRELKESVRERRRIGQTRTQDRQSRSVSTLKVLDFSADNDQQPDSKGEYTGATLEAGPLPESFTICSAFMVEVWTTDFAAVFLFQLLNDDGYRWIAFKLYAANSYTEYEVMVGQAIHLNQTEAVFFPLQWTQACLSLDSSRIKLVANGLLLVDEEYKKDEDMDRPANLNLRLGFSVDEYGYSIEDIGKFTNLNIFKSSLPVQRMIGLTTAGGEEYGAPGDLVNWEEAEWTLHSQAKVIEVDREWEGPCRRESQVQVFTAERGQFFNHKDCMQHCQKISGGRSPPVITKEDWENLTSEVDLITEDRSVLPWMWLSATEGEFDLELGELGHWPETEIVNNETKKLEALETVWRDFYTGQRLESWKKPYFREDSKDTRLGDTYNCMQTYTDVPWDMSWGEW